MWYNCFISSSGLWQFKFNAKYLTPNIWRLIFYFISGFPILETLVCTCQLNHLILVQFCPNDTNQPRLNPILDPESPTPGRVQIGFIKYILGFNPSLNPFWGHSDVIGPIFGFWGPTRPVWTQKLGPKPGWNPPKWVSFGPTRPNRTKIKGLEYYRSF